MSLFECVIRVVGGLLAAHDLSSDTLFLERCGAQLPFFGLT